MLDHGKSRRDSPINPPDKGIRCQKADGPSQQPIDGTCKETVCEEKNTADKSGNVQFEDVVPGAVGEDPNGAGTAHQERLPPPVIVLQNVSRCLWEGNRLRMDVPQNRVEYKSPQP